MSYGSFPPPERNPYSSPEIVPGFASRPPTQKPLEPPSFAKGMVITDLILCVLRGGIGMFSLLVLAMSKNDPELAQEMGKLGATATFEVLTAFGIAIVGVSAGVGLLLKQKWGLILGYLTVAFTLGSVAVSISQAMIQIGAPGQQHPPGYQAGMVVGIAFGVCVRLALLGMYVAALVQYAKFFQRVDSSRPSGFAR